MTLISSEVGGIRPDESNNFYQTLTSEMVPKMFGLFNSEHNRHMVKIIFELVKKLEQLFYIYVRHSDEISRTSQIPITLHKPFNKCGLIWTILRF